MIYFDYAATSKKRKYIFEEMLKNFDDFNGNPGSVHASGRSAKKLLENARKKIADYIGANDKSIVFTSGGSEANNTVLNAFNKKGYEIISSRIEHPSILQPLKNSESDIILLNSNQDGQVDLNELRHAISEKTKLISVIFVNNETGIIQPIKEIREIIGEKEIWLHIDAVQALGHIEINIEELGCDSMSFSGHKLGGMNGFGVLYIRENLKPLITGGNQEKKRRAGTSYVMGAHSLARSLEFVDKEKKHIKEIRDYLLNQLDLYNIKYEINGNKNISSNHIVNLYIEDVRSDFLVTYMDMHGICISAGSACTAGSLEPSHVIENMYDLSRAKSSIRLSFGFDNTKEEVDLFVKTLKQLQEKNNER